MSRAATASSRPPDPTHRSGKGMGEAGGHRDRRQPFRCLVRARDRAPALHACSADTAKLRSSCRWVAPRFASRFRGARALPRRRRVRNARIQPSVSRRRNCPHTRPDRWIPYGLSPSRIRRRLHLRARSKKVRAVSPGLRCHPWLRNSCSSLEGSVGLPCSLTPLLWRSSLVSTGSFLRKSSRC